MSVLLLSLFLLPQGDDEPPLVRRPPHFNGAVGSFDVSARAEPAAVQAEDPVTYTVRLVATTPVRVPPTRPRLRDFDAFKEAFYIEDVAPAEGTRPDDRTWEFVYRLRPKSTAVQVIPGFPFVFFKPGAVPAWRGYQTKYTPEQPLTVKPREEVPVSDDAARPFDVPEATFAILEFPSDGPRDRPERLPPLVVLAALFAAPPVGCVVWYLVWRRRHPDAARQAERRRSRAAREALTALARTPAPNDDAVRRTVAVVGGYLRRRWAVPEDVPTPAEVALPLIRAGVRAELIERTSAFFRTCDAARFARDETAPPDLTERATQLILSLEAEPCSSSS